MTTTSARAARKVRPPTGRLLRRGRADDRGLTTLEWLLIVAAVAGLAALAVVLVQNVVSDTSEQIAGSSARKTAAQVAASAVVDESKSADPTDPRYDTWAKWENYFTAKCSRIGITYSDAGILMNASFMKPTAQSGSAIPTPARLAAADGAAPTSTKAQADCQAS